MARDSTIEIQEAMYTRLTGDATLQTLLGGAGRIHDRPDESDNYPYVTIGEVGSIDWSGVLLDGIESLWDIHVYTRDPSSKTCKQIMIRVSDLLHDDPLTLSSSTNVCLRFSGSVFLTDPDMQGVNHGVLTMRLLSHD